MADLDFIQRGRKRAEYLGQLIDEIYTDQPEILSEAVHLYAEPPHLHLKPLLGSTLDIFALVGKSPIPLPQEKINAWNETSLPYIRPREDTEGFEVGLAYPMPEGGNIKSFLLTSILDFIALARRAWAWFESGELLGSPLPKRSTWPEGWQGKWARLEQGETIPHPHLVFPERSTEDTFPFLQPFSQGSRLLLPSTPPRDEDPLEYLSRAEELGWIVMKAIQ